ncbi:dienelactone hydrolase [Aspergillus homomorphus CBS 101889]|uniref:Dienelactone hydrolase n=1 Tax=Aspergillus homomorphus (strain CBS 101889) TaxID=1450537 RepID=A0A395I1U9_ASPHC|nr:dienelactone hydrolase [Aspergillus homomorphus CBS 101889]RAL13715.1 dienelactone hydrolase [Aspergillus homomorphus CBS 101889]
MASISIHAPGASGFIYNNANLGTSRVCITAETPDFDNQTLRAWSDEGFDVVYVPFNNGGKEYAARLRTVKDGLGVGDNYAIIAFGDAASFCMDYFLKPTNASRLAALVAYYPTTIPDTRNRYSISLRVLCHLAGDTVDVVTIPTALGLQGKKHRSTKKINPGIGTGERLNIGWPTFTYASVQPGFAESDLEEYDRLASDLAWSRTLQVLRKAFGKDLDLESRWEEHLEARFFSMNLKATVEPYVSHLNPTVTCTPTMSGAIGSHALRRFYEHHFLRKLPPSMRLRLISRTVGADRVVDELYASFEHTEEIPWMLPGIPPTNKRVEVILVSIVSLRAGRLYSEHMYWDQASVLVQLGLLDPKYVPSGAAPGVDRLPVVGREAARRIVEEDPESEKKDYHNRLIRRARAKQKGKHGVVEESGTEAGDVEKPLGDGDGKGKNVQRTGDEQNGHDGEEHDGAVGDEHEDEEKPEANGQNGANGASKNPAAATVEDEPKSDD